MFSVREHTAINLKMMFSDATTGDDIIHIVDETPISYYGTYIVPKSSPFIVSYNTVIQIAREAGLIDFALQSALYRLSLSRMNRQATSKRQVIKMKHAAHLFGFWFACIIIATIVFVYELLTFYC